MRWTFPLCALILVLVEALALVGAGATSSAAETRTFTLYVRGGWLPLPDGSQVYAYGFTDNPSGPPQVPGPLISVTEGDSVEITLVNDLDPTANSLLEQGEGHTIHLHGLDVTTENDGVPETYAPGLVRQGESYTYRFVASHAGTFFYHCHENNVEHQQMGMYGPLVVHAANGALAAYTNGPAFDREQTVVLAEMDAPGHERARASVQDGGAPYNWLGYAPDYLIMSQPAPWNGGNGSFHVASDGGQHVLLRAINAGYEVHELHLPGPGTVVATDGRPWPAGPTTDTLRLGPGERYDLILTSPAGGLDVTDRAGPASAARVGQPSAAGIPTQANGATATYNLYTRAGTLGMPDGAAIPVVGYTENQATPAEVPGPTFTVTEGDTVTIHVVSDAAAAAPDAGFAIPALGNPADSNPAAGTYTYVAGRPGTYLYLDPGSAKVGGRALYGAFVVKPADGSTAYRGGPRAERQYTMVLSEVDSRQANEQPGAAAYAPNYFLINGRAYPDTEHDATSMVDVPPGTSVLVRTINGGRNPHVMHLHGVHFTPISLNGRPWVGAPMKDTLLIDPGDAYDLLFTADQAGDFPFHDHFEAANTNNGVWLGGMHTMVHIGEPHDHASPAVSGPAPGPASDSSRVFIRDNFYTPNFLTVPLGTTVTWEHQGKAQHTVSSLAGYFDSGTLNGGDTFTYTFTEPGQYNYFCRFHITNRGIIIVQ